jgi:hypothetical protein
MLHLEHLKIDKPVGRELKDFGLMNFHMALLFL